GQPREAWQPANLRGVGKMVSRGGLSCLGAEKKYLGRSCELRPVECEWQCGFTVSFSVNLHLFPRRAQ
ncbi:MAG TPA: hypothetical protein DCX54_07400, partial [Flavobacteriales bacterium]|nr:hypothetical protein [Flavobacteriales bacterium]